MSLAPFIHQIRDRRSLTTEQSKEAFDLILTGQLSEEQIAAFLLALRGKGEVTDEIKGAVLSMRSRALTIEAPSDAIDIVGTGGDARGTPNVSTTAAIIVASCGVPVAKHGNRAVTSKSGASDVLAALGVNLDAPFSILEQSLRDTNLCFLFAPRHHPAMRYVAPVRKKLGVRTIFNLLGPLTNPAMVKRHLIGAFSKEWLFPMAEVLHDCGSTHAWLTHGQDGMDELTTTTDSDVITLKGDTLSSFTLSPTEIGIDYIAPEELQGGDAATNAEALIRLLGGEKNAYRDIVVLNAAAALTMADKASNLKEGAKMAQEAIDSGAGRSTLSKLIEVSQIVPPKHI